MKFKYWFFCFLVILLGGIALNFLLSIIITPIIMKNEKEKFKKLYFEVFKAYLPTSFGIVLSIILLYSIKKIYHFDIELLLLSTIFISAIVSAIETKGFYNVIVCVFVFLYPIIVYLYKKIRDKINKKYNK